jgi:MFS family permease
VTGSLREGAGLGLRAFRHRNYRLFYAGQGVSLVGTWMQQVAQAWLVLQLTHDPLWLGVITAAQWVPVLFFGLFAGVLADALPKRPTLIAVQTVMMVLALLLWLLVVTGAVQLWMIFVIAVLLGIANAVDMPVRQAFGIEMVGREDLVNAVALNSAMFNGARVIGPAVAGIVIATTDIASAFLLNGLSFVAVIVGLLLLRDDQLHATRAQAARPASFADVRRSLREGITYVWSTPIVLTATIVVGIVATVGMNFQVLIPPYAANVLGVGADGFGFLMAASGIGSLIAALSIAFGRTSRPMLIGSGAVVLGISLFAMGLWHDYALALVLPAIGGAGAIAMASTANATIQLNVPDELRGRVLAVYTTVFAGSSPFGGLLIGSIASSAGVPTAFLVAGVSATAIGLVAVVWLRTLARRAAAQPVHAPAELPHDVPGGAMAPLRRR